MNSVNPDIPTQLAALASVLAHRRCAILNSWHDAVKQHPDMEAAARLTRLQFFDHIPDILDAYEQRLRVQTRPEAAEAERENRKTAAAHGLVRWQQSCTLEELMHDWGLLQYCLLTEVDRWGAEAAGVSHEALTIARQRLILLSNEGIAQSAAEYSNLQQSEASGRLTALEKAMAQLAELEQERAQAWREATHDLRGSVGAIKTAAAGLNRDRMPQENRRQLEVMLKNGVDSLHGLLNDLVDLARLESGQEKINTSAVDIAQALHELCALLKPIADERSLFLRCGGGESLLIEGDRIKVLRIAQNLILNALNCTERGGVEVAWERCDTDDAQRWLLSIEDTGPGFDAQAMPPVAHALKASTEEMNAVERKGAQLSADAPEIQPASTLPAESLSHHVRAGEGVGLSIVKRLCELLNASLDLETKPGRGTTFRVNFPASYN